MGGWGVGVGVCVGGGGGGGGGGRVCSDGKVCVLKGKCVFRWEGVCSEGRCVV